MANIYKGTLGLIGNTPLVEVINVEKELGLEPPPGWDSGCQDTGIQQARQKMYTDLDLI